MVKVKKESTYTRFYSTELLYMEEQDSAHDIMIEPKLAFSMHHLLIMSTLLKR